jgi:hypothetical protein
MAPAAVKVPPAGGKNAAIPGLDGMQAGTCDSAVVSAAKNASVSAGTFS